jgi:hypothetical protein
MVQIQPHEDADRRAHVPDPGSTDALKCRPAIPVRQLPTILGGSKIAGHILEIDLHIQKCREIDSGNANIYDRIYNAYHEGILETELRLAMIFAHEAARASLSPDQVFTVELADWAKIERLRLDQAATTNPGSFLTTCRLLDTMLTQHLAPFKPLREEWPDEMRLIDAWKWK